MDFQIVLPGKTIAGKGALSRAGLEKYGKKPLIVTGKHTAKSQAAAELLKYAPGGVVSVSYTHLTLPTSDLV